MSEIIKTEAIVLSKMNYRETSTIAAFYTKEYGKLSAVIKGARMAKSMIGMKVDVFNHLQIVLYKKSNRELQLVTQAELINYYPNIKSSLENLKYASAVLELIQAFTVEEEVNLRIYKGIVRILELFNSSNNEIPGALLIKFILFLLREIGYEIQTGQCSICQKEIMPGESAFFNFERGIVCNECSKDFVLSDQFSKELFSLIIGLRNNKNATITDPKEVERVLFFLERYLRFHIPEFKGIKSIHLY